MSALEGWARAWLVEPKYVTVFKPTMDVVRHYFSPFGFQTSSFISYCISQQELIGEGLPLHRSCRPFLHRARGQPCLVTWLRTNRLLSH